MFNCKLLHLGIHVVGNKICAIHVHWLSVFNVMIIIMMILLLIIMIMMMIMLTIIVMVIIRMIIIIKYSIICQGHTKKGTRTLQKCRPR
jgi:hypothetical protein